MNHDKFHPKHEQWMTFISLGAGAIAGSIAKTVIAPLDRTKINFQSSTINKSPFTIRRGIDFMIETVEKEKMLLSSTSSVKNSKTNKAWLNIRALSALWRGNTATLVRISPFAAIQFASHRKWKAFLHVDNIKNININNNSCKFCHHLSEHLRRFIAGSLAGVTASSMTYPLDLARARMAVTEKNKYSNLLHVFLKIIKEEGWIALYRGFTPTVLGSIPYAGTSFFTYETLKKLDTNYYKNREFNRGQTSVIIKPASTDVMDIKIFSSRVTQSANIFLNNNSDSKSGLPQIASISSAASTLSHTISPLHRLAYGALAGLAGQTSSYPLDVIRRRMQTTPIYKHHPRISLKESCPYTGIISTAKYIIKTEGLIRGLYKGLSMNWIKGPIAVGISFSTFDILQKYFQSLLV